MKHSLLFCLLYAMAVLAGCATTTTFTSTWKAPGVQTLDPQGRKVAAVFISADESSRRQAEDTLVRRIDASGGQGVASYAVLGSADLHDMDRVKRQLSEAGVDGVLTMRVIEEKQRVSYEPTGPVFTPYYMHFSRYWGYGWGAPYEPRRLTTDTVVSVETLVYSLKRDELIWAGISRTVNPAEVSRFVDEVADAAARQMVKQGLLKKS